MKTTFKLLCVFFISLFIADLANAKTPLSQFDSSFEEALKNKNYSQAIDLIDSVNTEDKIFRINGGFKANALSLSIKHGSPDVISALIDRGVDIRGKSKGELSPIAKASALGKVDIVKVFLDSGVVPSKEDLKRIYRERNGLKIAQVYQNAGYDIPSKKMKKLTRKKKKSTIPIGDIVTAVQIFEGEVNKDFDRINAENERRRAIYARAEAQRRADQQDQRERELDAQTAALKKQERNALNLEKLKKVEDLKRQQQLQGEQAREVQARKEASDRERERIASRGTHSSGVQNNTQTRSSTSTSLSSGCGVSSYTFAEEQAEKNRLGKIRKSTYESVPRHDYRTRLQADRDWEAGMSKWRNARHRACGIDPNRVSGSTRE